MIGRDQIVQRWRKQRSLTTRIAHDVSQKPIFPWIKPKNIEFRNRLLRLGLPSNAGYAGLERRWGAPCKMKSTG
jgi:hypothetical protein